MNCPQCDRAEVERVAREGMGDRVRSWLSQWPYRCRACGCRFYLSLQNLARVPQRPKTPGPVPPQPENPIEVKAQRRDATAAIVVRADTPDQLNKILFALNQAVSKEQAEYERSRGQRTRS